jgi:hypothetical protein
MNSKQYINHKKLRNRIDDAVRTNISLSSFRRDIKTFTVSLEQSSDALAVCDLVWKKSAHSILVRYKRFVQEYNFGEKITSSVDLSK